MKFLLSNKSHSHIFKGYDNICIINVPEITIGLGTIGGLGG